MQNNYITIIYHKNAITGVLWSGCGLEYAILTPDLASYPWRGVIIGAITPPPAQRHARWAAVGGLPMAA